MTDINRRTVLKGAAWSVPVVALTMATPLAAASEPYDPPVKCIRVTPNHGQGGQPGNKDWWQGFYASGKKTPLMSNGEAMSHPVWGPYCRDGKGNS